MGRLKSRVRFYLTLFFRSFRSSRRRRFFVRQWGARGVVASVQNDVLVVLIQFISLVCFCCMSWPFLRRTITFTMDELVDWRSFDLPFALALGHACPVVYLSSVLFVCSVHTFMLGWG